MKILAVDTTAMAASVALLEKDRLIAQFTTNHAKNHSQTIMPMIKAVLDSTGHTLSDVTYIACASGPGSFTGLRIGAATAKALAHGSGKKIIPVPTLDALAYNVFDTAKTVVPIMDARRGEVYTAFFVWENGCLDRISDYMAVGIADLPGLLRGYGRDAVFTGDGVPVYNDFITASGFAAAPINMQIQSAASVGALAFALVDRGNAVSYSDFTPFYIRKPQAEREYEEKNEKLERVRSNVQNNTNDS